MRSTRSATRSAVVPAVPDAQADSRRFDAALGSLAVVAATTVTFSDPERALSSVELPSAMNDAIWSVCAPGEIVGSRALQANPVAVIASAHVTPAASDRVPST